jgi:hypothetical protein
VKPPLRKTTAGQSVALAELADELRNKLTHPRLMLQLASEGRAKRRDLKRAIDYIDAVIERIEAAIPKSESA